MKPSYSDYRGFALPKSFTREAFESALEYQPASDDIFVSGYPKCGSTWTQNMVYLLMRGGTPLGAGEKLTEVFPHLEEVGREFVESLPVPRFIKTHLPFGMTPWHPRARYIYVARNPFDCAVSFFHHTRGFPQHYNFAEGTFDEYFECFLAGAVDFGDYFDNLCSWYDHRDDDNVLFMTYEGMKRDAPGAVTAIGAFLGIDTAGDSPLLEAVLKHSHIDSMRKNPQRWSTRRPTGMPAFIRRGVVGDWANLFSAEHTGCLLGKFRDRTAGTDIAALWSEILAQASKLSSAQSGASRDRGTPRIR